MTITLVAPADDPNPWQTARIRIKRMFENYRELVPGALEYSVTVEKNKKLTGYHAHFLLRGNYIKQQLMRVAAVRAGCGSRKPDLRRIKGAPRTVASYGLKSFRVAGYGLKSYEGETAAEALRINGGRLEHHSRGFVRVEGKPMLLDGAERHAKRQMFGALEGGVHFALTPGDVAQRIGDLWDVRAPADGTSIRLAPWPSAHQAAG